MNDMNDSDIGNNTQSRILDEDDFVFDRGTKTPV